MQTKIRLVLKSTLTLQYPQFQTRQPFQTSYDSSCLYPPPSPHTHTHTHTDRIVGYYGFRLDICCLSACRMSVRPSIFSFLNDNLGNYYQIFTKLGMYIDIVEIWFGIVNGQISSIFDSLICPPHVFCFPNNNQGKYQWVFVKLDMCIDIVEILFGISNGQIPSIFDSYLPVTHPSIFQTITGVNINGFSPNFVCGLILWRLVWNC